MQLIKGRIATDSAGSHVEHYPRQVGFKGILPRTVQLAKRHRDIHFQNFDPCLAPISVIITTLTSRSYEFCARNRIYDTKLDLLCDVIRRMPFFIQIDDSTGRRRWFIWNETTDNENFAEKWNADPRRAPAFYSASSVSTPVRANTFFGSDG
jgi:hypothetical protein